MSSLSLLQPSGFAVWLYYIIWSHWWQPTICIILNKLKKITCYCETKHNRVKHATVGLCMKFTWKEGECALLGVRDVQLSHHSKKDLSLNLSINLHNVPQPSVFSCFFTQSNGTRVTWTGTWIMQMSAHMCRYVALNSPVSLLFMHCTRLSPLKSVPVLCH